MWYVIQVSIGTEEIVRKVCVESMDNELLEDCFIIRNERMKKYQGKWRKLSEIMFPGYLFMRTERPEELFQSLKRIPKFTKLLGREEDYFLPISTQEEKRLKLLSGDNHIVEMSIGYIEGENIIINDGPLNGIEGMIKKINRHKREAMVELEFFGRVIEVTVGLEIVSKS